MVMIDFWNYASSSRASTKRAVREEEKCIYVKGSIRVNVPPLNDIRIGANGIITRALSRALFNPRAGAVNAEISREMFTSDRCSRFSDVFWKKFLSHLITWILITGMFWNLFIFINILMEIKSICNICTKLRNSYLL